jgi:uncharacterized membrane protein
MHKRKNFPRLVDRAELGHNLIKKHMTHSPSVPQRTTILALIFIGLLVSIYLGLFQLHVFQTVWDPFFPVGSLQVLESPLSKAFPIPDSLIGAAGYFAEAVTLLIGSSRRFGRGSRMLFLYSIIAMGMGAVSVGLMFYQNLVVQNWCTLCVLSALISMRLFFPGLQELTLSVRVVRERRRLKRKDPTDVKAAA